MSSPRSRGTAGTSRTGVGWPIDFARSSTAWPPAARTRWWLTSDSTIPTFDRLEIEMLRFFGIATNPIDKLTLAAEISVPRGKPVRWRNPNVAEILCVELLGGVRRSVAVR